MTAQTQEPNQLYKITDDDTELYLGWTTPAKIQRTVLTYQRHHPNAKLTKVNSTNPYGHWAIPRHGYILHFWTSARRTLCGRTGGFQSSKTEHSPKPKPKCFRCKKRLTAMTPKAKRNATL